MGGHQAGITCLQFKGNRLISGSSDSTLRIWDLSTGECLHILRGHTDGVSCLTLIDDNMIASGSLDNTINLWSIETGKLLHSFAKHVTGITCLYYKNNLLISGTMGGVLNVIDLPSRIVLQTLHGHSDRVTSIQWWDNPNGEPSIISSSWDYTLRVWNLQTGKSIHVLSGHTFRVRCTYIRGNILVSGSWDTTVRVWDLLTGKCIHTLTGHSFNVWGVQFEGKRLVTAGWDRKVKVWDLESGKLQYTLDGHTESIICLQFKGSKLVTAAKEIIVWDFDVKQNNNNSNNNINNNNTQLFIISVQNNFIEVRCDVMVWTKHTTSVKAMYENWLAAIGLVMVSSILAIRWKRPHPTNQSIEVGPTVQGEGRARRNAANPELVTHVEEDQIYTLYDSIVKSCQKFSTRKCFGSRPIGKNGEIGENFEFITYNEFYNRCETLFQVLVDLGVQPKSKIGIFSRNRVEWLVVQGACFMQSNIVVSFYETLGVESLIFVSKHAEIELAFCSKETLEKTKEIAFSVKELKTVVCFDDVSDEERQSFKAKNIHIYTYSELMERGASLAGKHKHVPPHPDDLCTIMYTSGTTGDPKGVMITHRNVISVLCAVKQLADVYVDDCHYSYLPYAHILERVVASTAFHYGAAVGIFCGDTTKILTEVKALKPTLFIGVPRVFERIKAGVFKEVAKQSSVKKTVFYTAYKLKQLAILYGFRMPLIEELINKIVFDKLKSQLGGRVRAILSGGAPLALDTECFLRIAFSCSVVQGYGLTESCGGTAVKRLDDDSLGTLGPPFVSCEAKLVDVPDLNYLSSHNPPTGEVCLRGPSIAIGYYKDDQKTKQDFKDGWFHTGDIGRWNPDGSLSIIDRKKNIFKLSQGEYVAVEKIENVLHKSEWIAQICVYGDSKKSVLVAIIHPHQDKAEEWAHSKGISGGFKEICANKDFNEMILKDINNVGRASKLFGFEVPKQIHIIHEAFSDTNDMMTPSFKLKRPQIKEHYQNEINQMYSKLD
ncbi:fatty acyl-CoA synthetase [Heterostelium album PN500]|uniref:Long-chain-fatty-acid--CoA ligase n=1 Tax=Heterostelium pallidum (strain ATCC 26659 / Pp 5 / PN500) TaxID=670386 RepID=D3AZ71_HETP5|nr:fatty acyl-CoA synthetase [Heterostelium album PN500]EFA85454.1 fatty acyl-CoA synthetase [Heterostelium album PN500]|eukprot:XP_020437563.1 fatty acyl-CoA synthetase [Heterostelium album PN500]